MAGKIFINYRRDDSISTAGRLQDRLAQTFGRKNLFMDVDHVPAGVDFVDYLHRQVVKCDVFLAVIGPNWVDAKDDSGSRRFDNPNDYVAVEIAAALARNIRVIPVLIDGARTPKDDKLPDSIKPLVRRNAVEVRNTNFGRDADALVNKIREALNSARGPWRSVMASAGVAISAAALLLGWIGLHQMGVPVWVPWTPARYFDLMSQAHTELKNREYDKVIAIANEAIQLNPKGTEGFAIRGRAYAVKGDSDRVIADASEAIRLDVKNADAFVTRGVGYADKYDYDRAIGDYTQAMRLQADNPRAFINRGKAYWRKYDYDRAIADYTEAIRLDSNFAPTFFYRGIAHGNKGETDRAISDYNEAIRLDPNFADAFCQRGRTRLETDKASANADIAKARQLGDATCK